MRSSSRLWALIPLFLSAPAQAEPEDRGPLSIAELDAGDVLADAVMIPVKVHYPSSGGPYPVVLVMHGFVRTGQYHVELARTLASRGMVVILPDMPCGLSGCDHEANARQVRALLDWSVAESAGNGPLAGKIDGAHQGVLGHSWGGLGVFLSTQMPGLSVVALLDANDDRGIAADAAPMVMLPSIHITATVQGSCNATHWGDTVYPVTGVPRLRLRVVGAGHCDAEEPSDNFCPTICGRGDPTLSYLFRRYAVSFLGCVLIGDPAYAPYVGGTGLDADVMLGRIDSVDSAGLGSLPCQLATPTDAGVSIDAALPDDAGAADSGAIDPDGGKPTTGDATIEAMDGDTILPDSGVSIDAGANDDAGSMMTAPIVPADSGCSATGLPLRTSLLAWLLLIGGLCVRAGLRARTGSSSRAPIPAWRTRTSGLLGASKLCSRRDWSRIGGQGPGREPRGVGPVEALTGPRLTRPDDSDGLP